MHFFFVIFVYNQQRNQAGNSPAMELMGFQSCMDFLIGYGLLITAFVSDRHVSIAAYMRKSLTNITHYFDIWHLKKSKHNLLFIYYVLFIVNFLTCSNDTTMVLPYKTSIV